MSLNDAQNSELSNLRNHELIQLITDLRAENERLRQYVSAEQEDYEISGPTIGTKQEIVTGENLTFAQVGSLLGRNIGPARRIVHLHIIHADEETQTFKRVQHYNVLVILEVPDPDFLPF